MFEHDYISFFTATILEWKPLLQPDKYKQLVLDSLSFLARENRVKVYAFVIMPNHIHLLWKVQPPFTLPQLQLSFMRYTAQMIKFDLQAHHASELEKFYVGAKDRQYQFWERNPLTTFLYCRETVEQKLTYIHNNPVQGKWMLADEPEGYYYSSVRFYEADKDEFGFLTHYMEDV